MTVPAFTFCPYTTKHNNLGLISLILCKTTSFDNCSALTSINETENPIERQDSANNKDQVGGSIDEYSVDKFW